MKVAAFLPVKGSSERVENKNIRLLDGKPLFLHTLEKLLRCEFIDEVWLDSESEAIHQMAAELPCLHMHRDPALANNKTDGNRLFMNEVHHSQADVYIQILGTSPFISIETLRTGVETLKTQPQYDSAILVRAEKQYTWSPETLRPVYDLENIPNSFNLPDTLIETMGLYMMRREAALATNRRIGEKPFLLHASALEAVDVNYPDDFELANLIAAGMREKERKLLNNLAMRLSSSMISDVMDDLGIRNQIISGLKLNMEGKKIFGRAKTLKIKKKEPSDTNTIYDALLTYQTIVPGDVIMVENELPQFAYFGELNANLSIRSGAVGAVVGGMTRDSREVKGLNFPVFAQGYTCTDIKHNGTVASMNRSIQIMGVQVGYEDLVFGDQDGIAVIPKRHEKEVLQRCMDTVKRENNILNEVAEGIPVETIRARHGDF